MALLTVPAIQLAAVATVGIAAILAGHRLYREAADHHRTIERRLRRRKHPRLRDVLFSISWLPAIVLGSILLVRGTITLLPHTSITPLLRRTADTAILLVLLWGALRTLFVGIRHGTAHGDETAVATQEGSA